MLMFNVLTSSLKFLLNCSKLIAISLNVLARLLYIVSFDILIFLLLLIIYNPSTKSSNCLLFIFGVLS